MMNGALYGGPMLNPITVHVRITAQPGKSSELKDFLASALPQVRQSPGCHGAQLLADAEQEDALLLIEQWASVARHEDHVAKLQSSGLMDRVMTLAAAPPRSEYFAASGPGSN